MSYIQLNIAFLLFWSILGEFHWKLLFIVKKKNISERGSEIIRKFVFLNKFEKEQIQRKIRISCKSPFLFKAVILDKYKQKNVFLLKMSHTQLNYASLLFRNIFGEIHWKPLFFCQKSDYLRKEHWNTQKVCFS